MKTNQKGFTLVELLIVVVGGLGAIVTFGGVVWVAWHFISKFW